MPENKRNSVFAIYAFCRSADDAIDISNSMEKLLKLEEDLDRLVEGDIPDSPIFRALEDSFNEFSLDSKPFYDMIKGQKLDFNFYQPETIEQFKKYCYYVAGSVGLMLLPIIATQHKEDLNEAAIELGEAMQITNILRDVGEDYANGRIYIPKELLREYPKALQAIETSRVNDDFIRVWESLAEIVKDYYTDLLEKIDLFDKDSRKAVASSALYYGEILNVIRKNDYDCLTKRNYVSSFDALNIKLKAMLK